MKKVYETPAIEEVLFDTMNILSEDNGSGIEDMGDLL